MHLLRGRHNASFGEVFAREILSENANLHNDVGCVATIGNFDGVHLGHQEIIRKLRQEAQSRGLPSLVILFEPQPMEFFKGAEAPARLMRFRDKFEAISTLGVDFLFCLKFDAALSSLTAQAFVESVLVEHLSVKHLVVGDDFRFGGDRSGDFNLLCQLGQRLGFSVENTDTITAPETSTKHERASSTYVRTLLAEAEFDAAEKVLGRPYTISGRVVHGEKLGRQLGFPTANIALHRVNVPFKGVYAVTLELESAHGVRVIQGVANIGVKPTVGVFKPNLEVHLFDFEEDIYGARVKVRFHSKLRGEQRFDGVEALMQQIELDVKQAKEFLSNS